MITLVWRTDLHLADQAPQSRTDNWTETLMDKIVQVGGIAKKEGAVGVLDGGDFFNIKSPSRNSHSLVNRAVKAHREYPCPVWATIGNHDCKYGSSEFLEEGPLGVLFETGVFNRLYDQHEASFEEGDFVGIGGHQFVNGSNGFKNKFRVRVVGVPYHGTQYDMDRFLSIKKGDEDFLVAVVHCLASEKGGSMFEGEDILKYSDLATLAPDVFAFGHWHKDQGVKEIAPGKWVVNTGSLSRGSISQDDVNRIPKCVSLHFSPGKFEFKIHPLNVRPSSEIFDIGGRERRVARTEAMDTFVGHLKEDLTFRTEDIPLVDAIKEFKDIPENVKERAIFYVEQAGKV